MTINDLIRNLESIDRYLRHQEDGNREEKCVYYDFCGTHPTTIASWRGVYTLPALGWNDGDWRGDQEPAEPPTVSALIDELKSSIGKFFSGWKGGDYSYNGTELLYVANPGHSGATFVDGVSDEGWCVVIRTRYQEDAW